MEIEAVLEKREVDNTTQYLVKKVGSTQDFWVEPETIPELLLKSFLEKRAEANTTDIDGDADAEDVHVGKKRRSESSAGDHDEAPSPKRAKIAPEAPEDASPEAEEVHDDTPDGDVTNSQQNTDPPLSEGGQLREEIFGKLSEIEQSSSEAVKISEE